MGSIDRSKGSYALPDESSWCFDKIRAMDERRAELLEEAADPEALLHAVSNALANAIAEDSVRYGWEHARQKEDDCRAVIQFGVGAGLFDWFFNARTGYRAHFRGHHELGMAFNDKMVERLRDILTACLPDFVPCVELRGSFEPRGIVDIPKDRMLASLVPELSKVWACTLRITPAGNVEKLALGVTDPKLLVDNLEWLAIYRDDDEAWLQLMGAFLGREKPYQIKDPLKRAITLQKKGEA